MTRIRNLKLKAKLSLLVAIFVVVFIAFAALSYNTLSKLCINGPKYGEIIRGKDLVADILPPPEYIIEAYLKARLLADPSNRNQVDSLAQDLANLRKIYFDRQAHWTQALPRDSEDDINLRAHMLEDGAAKPATQFFNAVDAQLIPAVRRGDYALALQLVNGPLRQNYNDHRAQIDQVVQLARKENSQRESEANDIVTRSQTMLIALGIVIVLVVTLGLGLYISSSIASALQETANSLSSTSSEIASAIEQHERTAMHQSAAVHETTATMDELDASFRQTMDMVTTAAETAREAASVAEDGIRTVQHTLDGMLDTREKVNQIAAQILSLSERTGQIGNITNLVSDLANQTNMLALNAAVEAARAGEHGKGFSVVASEIRKLADESKKSAERISGLVEDIQRATNSTVMATEEGTKNVERGIRLAEETVNAFNMVLNSSTSASDAAQQTLLSVPQQVTAVRQVLTSMESLTTGARETADGIGQTKVGVDALRHTALRLKEMI